MMFLDCPAYLAPGGAVRCGLPAEVSCRFTILPGGGRTEPEYARLLAGAGFRPEPAISLARIESVIMATPAS